ncbi:MAG: NUDIX hydrolase [Gammaproteobacteria bacterium]
MTIHVTVATVIQDQDRFLIVRESTVNRPDQIVINQPAGHVEPGESLVEAAIRETLEETGWLCSINHCIGIYHYVSPSSQRQYLRTCFAGELVRQEHSTPLDNTIISAEWMPLKDITAIHTATEHNLHQSKAHGTPTSSSPNSQPLALRNPTVLDCIHDYLKGQIVPWHCVKESTLNTNPQALIAKHS